MLIEKIVLKACYPTRLCETFDSSDEDISGSTTNFWLDGDCQTSAQYPPFYYNKHLCSGGKIINFRCA